MTSIFDRPFDTKATTLAGQAQGPGPNVPVRGIEIVQAVQSLDGNVTLIAGKATFARFYVDPRAVGAAVTVRGELAWRRGSGGVRYLPSINVITLDPAASRTLSEQRSDAALSLNFRLPVEATAAGVTSLFLKRLTVVGGSDLPLAPQTPKDSKFHSAPPLRVRVVGLRYKRPNSNVTVAPDAVHFAYLRSYLERTYPTAELIWSQIVVDADFSPPFNDLTSTLANAQLAAMRSQEVSMGLDARTHYYGLVDDDGGRHFMRGRAYDIPGGPRPDVPACGPAGTPGGFAGDTDQSYADWYGAHELGHTFGRYHPGFPPGQQDASDATFPYDHGFISDPAGTFSGFDAGDVELGHPPRAIPGLTHHDIMTYADNQWISAYTFEAIRLRLIAEDAIGGA